MNLQPVTAKELFVLKNMILEARQKGNAAFQRAMHKAAVKLKDRESENKVRYVVLVSGDIVAY